jgi:hypothetical protein
VATDKQIRANRENAQYSTGPTSEAGKEAVSQNRTTHGLTGRFVFRSEEEIEDFHDLRRQLGRDLSVSTVAELELIEMMAQSLWRSRRAIELQDQCIDTLACGDEDLAAETRKNLELYIRYQASHDRAYQRYAAELRKLQAELKKAEIGFESQKGREAQEQRAQAQETRRLAAETRKAEDHKISMEIKQQRCEREKSLTIMAAIKAADKMNESLPPNWQELAAEMPQNGISQSNGPRKAA